LLLVAQALAGAYHWLSILLGVVLISDNRTRTSTKTQM
jgi:hypothetical protein